ncbi:hypothetical protein HDU89_007152 [Geranomyces variabilis]|nr:hypothetical protein HDU89_007152 [Geranomyces variabilis]
MASDILQYRGHFSSELLTPANFLSGAMGFFNSMIFLTLDPSFETARGQLRSYLVAENYLNHFIVVPSTPATTLRSTTSSQGTSLPPTTATYASDTEAGIQRYTLKPRGTAPTGVAYHTVRVLLLRKKDVQQFLEATRRSSSQGAAGKRTRTAGQVKPQRPGISTRASSSYEALGELDLSGSDAEHAVDEFNRL